MCRFFTQISNAMFKNRIKDLPLEEKLQQLKNKYVEIDSTTPQTQSKQYEKGVQLRELQKEIAQITFELQQIEATKHMQERARSSGKPEMIISFYDKINELSEKMPKDKYNDNMLISKTVLKKLRTMVSYVEENLNTIGYVSKIFELYIPEIINISEGVPNRKSDAYIEYICNFYELMRKLDELVDITTNKILNFTDKDIEASFNVLIKEMENDKNIK